MNLESRRLVWAGYSKLRDWRRPGGSEQKEGGGEDSGLIWGGGHCRLGLGRGETGTTESTYHPAPNALPILFGGNFKNKSKGRKTHRREQQ